MAACQSALTDTDLPAHLLDRPLHPTALAIAAGRHGLEGVVHRLLRHDPRLPQQDRDLLDGAWRDQMALQLCLAVDLATVARCLDGLRYAVVKGPALADTVYPRNDLRTYSDLDTLVDRRQFGEALTRLTDAGAVVVDRNWPLVQASMRGEHTLILPFGTVLDLHWHLLTERRWRTAFQYESAQVLDRLGTGVVSGSRVGLLHPTDTLIHLCTHAVLSGGHKLLWWLDVAAQVRHGRPDWDDVVATSRRQGLGLVTNVMLDRVERLLRPGVPPEAVSALSAGSRAWASTVHALDATRPAARTSTRPLTGQVLVRSTRQDTRASVAELGRALRDDVWTPLRKGQIGPRRGREDTSGSVRQAQTNPLHEDVPDVAAQAAYLACLRDAEYDPV